jgi:hypothetical protein
MVTIATSKSLAAMHKTQDAGRTLTPNSIRLNAHSAVIERLLREDFGPFFRLPTRAFGDEMSRLSRPSAITLAQFSTLLIVP